MPTPILSPALATLFLGVLTSSVVQAEDLAPSTPPAAPVAADAVPLAGSATSADTIPAVAPAPVEPPSPWTRKGRLGVFLNNTSTSNADSSHDATINGATDTTTFLGTVDADAEWKDGKHTVQNILKAKYGRSKSGDNEWAESDDEIRYDGVYRYSFSAPHFAYGAWGVETVFTGPHEDDPASATLPADDWSNKFDPLTAKASAGYGQLYENLWVPEKDRLEARLGARVQRQWGSQIRVEDRGLQTGIEGFLHYERTATAEIRFFGQWEGFSEFNDLQHLSNLITAGLTVDFASAAKALGGARLTVDLALRAYYETRPKEDLETKSLAGYNLWSIKQDTLIGATYLF